MKLQKGSRKIRVVLLKYNDIMYIIIESKQAKFSVFLHLLHLYSFWGHPLFRGSLLYWGFYFQEAKGVSYKE